MTPVSYGAYCHHGISVIAVFIRFLDGMYFANERVGTENNLAYFVAGTIGVVTHMAHLLIAGKRNDIGVETVDPGFPFCGGGGIKGGGGPTTNSGLKSSKVLPHPTQ